MNKYFDSENLPKVTCPDLTFRYPSIGEVEDYVEEFQETIKILKLVESGLLLNINLAVQLIVGQTEKKFVEKISALEIDFVIWKNIPIPVLFDGLVKSVEITNEGIWTEVKKSEVKAEIFIYGISDILVRSGLNGGLNEKVDIVYSNLLVKGFKIESFTVDCGSSKLNLCKTDIITIK